MIELFLKIAKQYKLIFTVLTIITLFSLIKPIKNAGKNATEGVKELGTLSGLLIFIGLVIIVFVLKGALKS